MKIFAGFRTGIVVSLALALAACGGGGGGSASSTGNTGAGDTGASTGSNNQVSSSTGQGTGSSSTGMVLQRTGSEVRLPVIAGSSVTGSSMTMRGASLDGKIFSVTLKTATKGGSTYQPSYWDTASKQLVGISPPTGQAWNGAFSSDVSMDGRWILVRGDYLDSAGSLKHDGAFLFDRSSGGLTDLKVNQVGGSDVNLSPDGTHIIFAIHTNLLGGVQRTDFFRRSIGSSAGQYIASINELHNGFPATMSTDSQIMVTATTDHQLTNSDGTSSPNVFYVNGNNSEFLLDSTAHWNQCTTAVVTPGGKYVVLDCAAAYPIGNSSKYSTVVVLDMSNNKTIYMSNDRLAALGLKNSDHNHNLIGFNDTGISFMAALSSDTSKETLVTYTFSNDQIQVVSGIGDTSHTIDGRALQSQFLVGYFTSALNQIVKMYSPSNIDDTQNAFYLLAP